MSGLLAERILCDIPFATCCCCPDIGGNDGRWLTRPLVAGWLIYELICDPSLEVARDIAGAVYRLGSSFQLADGWRPYGNPADWELDLVDGVSATGEKYEFMFLSPGDMLPADNWVCTDKLESGIG